MSKYIPLTFNIFMILFVASRWMYGSLGGEVAFAVVIALSVTAYATIRNSGTYCSWKRKEARA